MQVARQQSPRQPVVLHPTEPQYRPRGQGGNGIAQHEDAQHHEPQEEKEPIDACKAKGVKKPVQNNIILHCGGVRDKGQKRHD